MGAIRVEALARSSGGESWFGDEIAQYGEPAFAGF
jgi:hypothetical protein